MYDTWHNQYIIHCVQCLNLEYQQKNETYLFCDRPLIVIMQIFKQKKNIYLNNKLLIRTEFHSLQS